jgi:hypothetical protein
LNKKKKTKGPTSDAASYFEKLGFVCPPNVNLADFLMDVLSGEITNDLVQHPQQLFDLWEQHPKPFADPASPKSSIDSITEDTTPLNTLPKFLLLEDTPQVNFKWMIFSFFFPLLGIPLTILDHMGGFPLKAKFFSLFGGLTGFFFINLILLITLPHLDLAIQFLFGLLMLFALCSIGWFSWRYHKIFIRDKDNLGIIEDCEFYSYFVTGFLIGPFTIFYSLSPRINVKVALFAGKF